MASGKDYPIMLDLNERWCLVVGGGHVSVRKIGGLLAVGAHVLVVSPYLCDQLVQWRNDGKLSAIERSYQTGDLYNPMGTPYQLVFAATDRREVNRQVVQEAQALGIPVTSATDPDDGTFRLPAVLRRGDLTISVSTGGASPMLTQHIRDQLANTYGDEYEQLIDFFAQFRQHVLRTIEDETERRRLFASLIHSNLSDYLIEIRESRFEERKRNLWLQCFGIEYGE